MWYSFVNMTELSQAKELPEYECHKHVRALKIIHVHKHHNVEQDLYEYKLEPEDDSYRMVRVDQAFYDRHRPEPGGYFVLYEDGYTSFSPAKAFEAGYTKI